MGGNRHMFDKEYSFKGTHAEKVNKLTAKFDGKNQLFKRNLDVYMMAPIVGFLYQRKADVNTGDGTQKPTKIFPLLGSFYPFSILAKSQTLSKFEANFHKPTGKKDNSKDK